MLGSMLPCVLLLVELVWFPGSAMCVNKWDFVSKSRESADRPNCVLFGRIISLIGAYNLIMLLFAVLLTIQHDVYVMSLILSVLYRSIIFCRLDLALAFAAPAIATAHVTHYLLVTSISSTRQLTTSNVYASTDYALPCICR